MPEMALAISVNGGARTCPAGTTVSDLLASLGLGGKKLAVERNGEIVPRSEHGKTALSEGDVLEIVVAVGGG